MVSATPRIEIFDGISEELSDVSLRRVKDSATRRVVMTFSSLQALEKLNSFTKGSSNTLRLIDEEGVIAIEPQSVRSIYGGEEKDELKAIECRFDIDREDHWERFMRFMHRYAEANGMAYGDSSK
ncbi:MAG: photosystem II reaction center protein Psb28 [Cyanosarcina radialis HA8281-LM2]|jgi:photosystem II Psb28-2 protein|nr:photosystem II reaction center protein Psb28 [Cyanosarcina radialis HA8281-LM2]